MSSRLYSISAEECIGDALAKINSNFVSLDTAVCNIQTNADRFDAKQSKLNSLLDIFVFDADRISEKDNYYTRIYNTIKTMSPYWRSKQYTIFVEPHTISPYIVNKAEAIRVSIINKKFPVADYPEFTIVNAVITNFNRPKWKSSGNFSTETDPTKVPHVDELSQSIHRYLKTADGVWTYIESIEHKEALSAVPDSTGLTNLLLLSSTGTFIHNDIRHINLVAKLSSAGGISNLPATDFMSWDWYIDDSAYTNLPVSAVSLTTTPYEGKGTLAASTTVSAIQLQIKPNKTDDILGVSSLYVVGYNFSDNKVNSSIITLPIVDLPGKQILNISADIYDITDSSSGVLIGNTDYISTIVRDSYSTGAKDRNYRFVPKITIEPPTSEFDIMCRVDSYQDICNSSSNSLVSTSVSGFYAPFEVRSDKQTTKIVTICAYNIESLAWQDTMSVSSTVEIHNTDAYNSKLSADFIVYSKYAWDPRLRVVSPSTPYTATIPTTAYGGRKDLTAEFYVSAVDNFDLYVWKAGEYTLTTTENTALLEIPYTREMFTEEGLSISLTGYNSCLPIANKSQGYIDSDGSIKNYPSYTSTTISASNIQKRNIKLLPYGEVLYSYYLVTNTGSDKELDIKDNNKIKIRQFISRFNLNNDIDIVSGTVTYIVSTDKWSTEATVPALDGEYIIACLEEGDGTSPLSVRGNQDTDIRISTRSKFTVRPKDSVDQWESMCYPGRYINYVDYFYPPTPTPTPTHTPTNTPTPTRTPKPDNYIEACSTSVIGDNVVMKSLYTYRVNVNNGRGNINLSYVVNNGVARFKANYKGAELANTNFVGSNVYQTDLLSLNLPGVTEISGPASGLVSISITDPDSYTDKYIDVTVEAPLPGTDWSFNVGCLPSVDLGTQTPTPPVTNTRTPTQTPTYTNTRTQTPTITPSQTFGVGAILVPCDGTASRVNQTGIFWYKMINSTGKLRVVYNSYAVPERFIAYYKSTDGTYIEVDNTGFRGTSDYDPDLQALGLPPTSGGSSGDIDLTSVPTNTEVYLSVECPLENSRFDIYVECIDV